MCHQRRIERLRQVLGAAAVGDIAVRRMVPEEVCLCLERLLHRLIPLDVLLGPIHDTNEAQLKGIHAARQYIQGVGAMVHQVDFCQHADSSPPQRVDMAGQLECLGIDNVDICG